MGGERPAAAFFWSQPPNVDLLHGKADTGLIPFLTFTIEGRGAPSESCPLKTESTLLISHILYITFSQCKFISLFYKPAFLQACKLPPAVWPAGGN